MTTQLLGYLTTKEHVGKRLTPVIELESNIGLMAQAATFFYPSSKTFKESEIQHIFSTTVDKMVRKVKKFMVELPDDSKDWKSEYFDTKTVQNPRTYLNLWEISGIPAFDGLFSTLSLISKDKRIRPVSPAKESFRIPLKKAMKYIDVDSFTEFEKLQLRSKKKVLYTTNPLMVRLTYGTGKDMVELYFFHALYEYNKQGLRITIDKNDIKATFEKNTSLGTKMNDFGLPAHQLFQLVGQTLYTIGACSDLLKGRIDLSNETKACLPGADLSGDMGYPYLRRPVKPEKEEVEYW